MRLAPLRPQHKQKQERSIYALHKPDNLYNALLGRPSASTLAQCNTARRAAPRLARRATERRIRFWSADSLFRPPRARHPRAGPDEAIALAKERPERRPLRLFVAMRSRYAEIRRAEQLTRACGKFWCSARVSTPSPTVFSSAWDLSVFELDHPATQSDKRRASPKRKSPNPGMSRTSPMISSTEASPQHSRPAGSAQPNGLSCCGSASRPI